ncbi:uncharacterized protein LOC116291281 [Actinia tenebrosa]|uniref:Uncharacterized protein LOC116291281 n=1 Tax=Actinia tenebrosa TaxID=6105 RepID=A0A6P8HH66_ACTTE|nr:uncharacterized protein LOC116291281 [Actinia tenebrosa]
MANIFKRKGCGIIAAVFSIGALVMIIMALVTEHWVYAALLRKGENTTAPGGTKDFGLFDGHVTVNFGLGQRGRDFKVKDEFEGVANDNAMWATLGFALLSIPFICIGIGMLCYNEFSKTNLTICGTLGIFIAHSIAFLLILVAVAVYGILFESQLKENVLRPDDKRHGFDSTGLASLEYSFWVLLGAAAVVLLSPFIFLLSKAHLTHYFKTSPKACEAAVADGVMLY